MANRVLPLGVYRLFGCSLGYVIEGPPPFHLFQETAEVCVSVVQPVVLMLVLSDVSLCLHLYLFSVTLGHRGCARSRGDTHVVVSSNVSF